jgi:hypothetical protein
MKHKFLIAPFVLVALAIGFHQFAHAQDYLYATGNPTFSVNVPVDHGYINVANGNLHLEIPIATHAQRGNLKLDERLVYDSRIWMIGHYSNYYWWPNNVPGSMAGWRFVSGLNSGSIGLTLLSSSLIGCPDDGGSGTSKARCLRHRVDDDTPALRGNCPETLVSR